MAQQTEQAGTQGQGSLRRTPLNAVHQRMGAKMVEFGGWDMPVRYTGDLEEHRAVRTAAGLFDLGHMGQVDVTGPDALPFLQWLLTNDFAPLPVGKAQYTLLCNPAGGVLDDLIVYRLPERWFVVLNAANRESDVAWIQARRAERRDLDLTVADVTDQTGMLALQGPRAEAILQKLTSADLANLPAFGAVEAAVASVPALIGRTGYTGEDGFELYFPVEQNEHLWEKLLEAGRTEGLQPIGLGARDTLRLEAKMALYGHELSEEINPLEAGVGWAVNFDKGDFVGREALLRVKEQRPARRLVGFRMVERGGAPRAGYEVQVNGEPVGHVTSGTFSPTLMESIGLALVRRDAAGVGKPLDIMIRGRPVRAEQVKTPFYKRAAQAANVG
jgi:aminomethyltransferase